MWYYTLMIVASLEGRPITVVEHNMTLEACTHAAQHVSKKVVHQRSITIDSISCEREAKEVALWQESL